MEKINIAELLKDCPNGMELDCTMYDEVSFIHVLIGNTYPIRIETPDGQVSLDKYGCYSKNKHAKCVIFPKGKNTWEGFQKPFKDGDIVATTNGLWIGITTGGYSGCSIPTYCIIHCDERFEAYLNYKEKWKFARLANEDEKEKLFKAIKDNGYKWNEKTKTLEKLVPNKFDIATLKPFESKVLVRDIGNEKWRPAIWGFSDSDSKCDYPYKVVGGYSFSMCIPYNGNEHLLGTTEDCDEYYKNWE